MFILILFCYITLCCLPFPHSMNTSLATISWGLWNKIKKQKIPHCWKEDMNSHLRRKLQSIFHCFKTLISICNIFQGSHLWKISSIIMNFYERGGMLRHIVYSTLIKIDFYYLNFMVHWFLTINIYILHKILNKTGKTGTQDICQSALKNNKIW